MKALILKFLDAEAFVFPSNRDQIHTWDVRLPRGSQPRFRLWNDTLTTQHVSNVLHVLANERPVPSLRPSAMKVLPELYEMAKKSYVEMQVIAEEEKTMRRALFNAYYKTPHPFFLNGKDVKVSGGYLYHDRLRLYLGEELYEKFLQVLEVVSGKKDPKKHFTAVKAIEFLNANNTHMAIMDYVQELIENQKKSVANLLAGSDKDLMSVTFQTGAGSKLNLLTINSGIERIRKFRGCIYVPVTEEQLKYFSKGSGVARLMEGGYVQIFGVENWSESLVCKAKSVREGEIYVPDQD